MISAITGDIPARVRAQLSSVGLRDRLVCLCAALILIVSLPGVARSAAIAAAHPLAVEAGNQVLAQGGNAFDAAIAVAASLAVVEPYSSGLGGGGFFLLHRARDGFQVVVDARETAPAGANAAAYLDSSGKPLPGATTRGGRSVAIPGLPAALVHLEQRYGRLPLAAALAPAIAQARGGYPVDERYSRIAKLRERFLREGTHSSGFLDQGRAPAAGFRLVQSELGATLERVAKDGVAGFYQGPVAQALVDTVNGAGGNWRLADLAAYRVIEREPVTVRYRDATITAASLPSAGGIALAQALGMLSQHEPGAVSQPATAHLVAEVLRRVFHDRARYLGDPDFYPVPVRRLLDAGYIRERAASIDPARATRSAALPPAPETPAGSGNTTHFSIIDAQGNRVAATLTINLLFGSGIVGAGTGVLLNNEMDDFTVSPGTPNAFRLQGSAANAIAPGKRPLSSMTPAFVEDAKGVLVLGAPGGSRIISQVLLVILEYLRQPEVDPAILVDMPRYHHQYLPDQIEIEPGAFDERWQAQLRERGHKVVSAGRRWGNMQLVYRSARDGVRRAASDPRGRDIGWY